MKKLLEKLLNLMGVGTEVVYSTDGETAIINLPLGIIPAGTYEDGLWDTVKIEDTDAVLTFMCGNIYGDDEFAFGEGTVNLNYADDNEGLAYTSDLETVITDRIKDLYGLDAGGSEQGMQGDEYLSLDIYTELEQTQAA